MDTQESTTPWRCEVPWHAHTDDQRGPTCRPDSVAHPEAGGTCPTCFGTDGEHHVQCRRFGEGG
ncbi:hypothetical protein AB0H51_28210 [Streptomyces griseoluteus]|uniref:hypothetical protein n=1 Tax=Streptomyces griseoluteus TaxID=29306 RepID=UPI0033C360FA